MDSLPTVVTVAPKPGLPKVIGSLNVAFGFMLFLIGLECLNLIGPSFTQNQPFKLERGDAQSFYDQFRQRQIFELQAREESTTDESKKAALRAERLELTANPQKDIDKHLDLKSINHVLLLLNWYFWADFATAPVLNLLMLASGIGLTQLRIWARKMAIWVALLKIVRILALTFFFTIVVVPQARRAIDGVAHTELGKVIIMKANAAQIKASTGPPAVIYTAEDFALWMATMAYFCAVFGMILCLIYPAISLVILTRPSVKAACCLDEVSGTEEREGELS
ncbi:hypothetical protein [Singulisphaera acidiphila]|uniref:Uncharacterized protein n=1 Tax=Singulisphaera acidiphila (strain ATCC BAA-1392 / DSM 18658 / VKM B-2454 / MOB10) TaxID=886293 RepID=L0DBD6_SINAD|nr:hypothetical protein [Singulisphaera acidiphila]AGA26153.1 hypothetical protein Sinac_1782 [Singulisphaera acidiphila DSM 18658]